MTDGAYASISDLPDVESVMSSVHAQPPTPKSATLPPRETSSFDALMKLKDLAECIEDAERTRSQVTQQIETLIQKNRVENHEIAEATHKRASLKSVRGSLDKTRRAAEKLKEDKSIRRGNLEHRRGAIGTQETALQTGEAKLRASVADLDQKRSQQAQLKAKVTGQMRRIAQDILDVFPIDPIDQYPLCFTIRSHFLPNAKGFEQDRTDFQPASSEDATAAALGYVVQILLMLEANLMIPLPYMPTPCGSTSTIFDPLSSAHELGMSTSSSASNYHLGSYFLHSPQSGPDESEFKARIAGPPTPATHPFRTFPLYQHSAPAKRFRWAIYLLNRDIEELMQQSGIRVMDPRNTLANLKFLLTVLASGKGDMPGRKLGVIRGLHGR